MLPVGGHTLGFCKAFRNNVDCILIVDLAQESLARILPL